MLVAQIEILSKAIKRQRKRREREARRGKKSPSVAPPSGATRKVSIRLGQQGGGQPRAHSKSSSTGTLVQSDAQENLNEEGSNSNAASFSGGRRFVSLRGEGGLWIGKLK